MSRHPPDAGAPSAGGRDRSGAPDGARPEAWIHRRDLDEVAREAAAARTATGQPLGALAGRTLAVKDNIDVAGLPTTCAHPAYARVAERSAAVVARLEAAGVVVAGKTNMDQFATGLVGTRSPYGACRNAADPGRISGGSSSGSAVAVALGEVDLALGTDTAGSGRVPAALQGIVGLKPTRGVLPVDGVVPACVSFDCVSVLARTVGLAAAAARTAAGGIGAGDGVASARPVPPGTPAVPAGRLRIGVPRPGQLAGLDPPAELAWRAALAALEGIGILTEIDLGPYLAAGELLYEGALVAERWAAFGPFLAAHPDGADPSVAAVADAAATILAADYVRDRERLRARAEAWAPVLAAVDVVALPTVGEAPTLAEVRADPQGVNRRLGRFTNGCNLLDLCAAAVPCGVRDDGLPFGVTFLGAAFADAVVAAAGARLCGEPDPPPPPWSRTTRLVTFGAHMRGQPLEAELADRGGRFVAAVRTAPAYRLFALATTPPKPALVRAPGGDGGCSVGGELWELPVDAFGDFVRRVPPPLAIGTVALADGACHPGFVAEPGLLGDAVDISRYGSWRRYLGQGEPGDVAGGR